MSLALNHKNRTLRAKATTQATSTVVAAHPTTIQQAASDTIIDALTQDLRTLKKATDKQRHQLKQSLIEKYQQEAQNSLSQTPIANQKLVFYWLLWRMDVEGILNIWAEIKEIIKRNLTPPPHFKSDFRTVAYRQFEAWLQNAHQNQRIIDDPEQNQMHQIYNDFTQEPDLPLNQRRNIYTYAGHLWQRLEHLEKALACFQIAQSLDEKAGHKKRITQLQQQISTPDSPRTADNKAK